MKKNQIQKLIIKNIVPALLAGCAALGWWGALYPQFTLLRGTYEIVCEEDEQCGEEDGQCVHEAVEPEEHASVSEPEGAQLYWDILEADCSRIRFKSRLFMEWNALHQQRREVHESGSE